MLKGSVSMSIITDETHAVARKILSRLAIRPLRVRDVWKLVIQDSAGVSKTMTVFYWLRDNGYIQKTCGDYCSPYGLTEKGQQFLAALT